VAESCIANLYDVQFDGLEFQRLEIFIRNAIHVDFPFASLLLSNTRY